MSAEEADKVNEAEDVDFGEAEDFDDLPAEDAPNEETLVADDAPADNGSAAADGNNQAAPANGQSEAASTVAADATEVDGADGQAETGPTAASVPVANAAAVDAGGNAGTASKINAVKTLGGGGADPLDEPAHGSEVFVGGISKSSTVTDEQLLEFASAAGEVYSCAVLTDPGTGLNRGYGFIKFKSKEIAQVAMDKLNDTEMKDHPGVKIRVLPSQSKNRLYLGNLPKEMEKAELQKLIKDATKGLESVELVMSKDWPGQNRGFCFLEFYNHACAQAAKVALSPPHFKLGSKPLTITFAEPRRADSISDQSQEIKSIFVGNLPESANEAKLKELFAPLGEITRAFIPAPRDGKKRREFGFVHFQDRASVSQAIANCDRGEKLVMDGMALEVKLGRVYHENPPQRQQLGSMQQGGTYGRGAMGNMGMSMGAGRFGGGGRGRQNYQQQPQPPQYSAGRMGGGGYSMNVGYGGDYGQYSGAMAGMVGGYNGGTMDAGYGSMVGGEEHYDDGSYGSYGNVMGTSGGMAAAGSGMAMVPMMLPNGQVGYVLSNAGTGAMPGGSGGVAGGVAGGMTSNGMGLGGPMRGRSGYNMGTTGSGAGGGYGAMGRGRGTSGGYGGRAGAQQRYTPY